MTTCNHPHPTIPRLTCPHDSDHDMRCFIIVKTEDPEVVKVLQWDRDSDHTNTYTRSAYRQPNHPVAVS